MRNYLHHIVLTPMILLISLFFIGPSLCAGQTEGNEKKDGAYFDPLDPFDYFGSEELNATDDKDKSAEELVRESLTLFQTEHLLDARTKLLKALQKDPENIRAHYFLAGYYLSSVGHYRLALKYAKRALELAEKKHAWFESLRKVRPMKPSSDSSYSRRSVSWHSVGIFVWISPMASYWCSGRSSTAPPACGPMMFGAQRYLANESATRVARATAALPQQ